VKCGFGGVNETSAQAGGRQKFHLSSYLFSIFRDNILLSLRKINIWQ
jgi:hypothetical protein